MEKGIYKHSKEAIEKMKRNHADFSGEKNPRYKGERVSKSGLHIFNCVFKEKQSKLNSDGKLPQP